jgi:hypothetical protein
VSSRFNGKAVCRSCGKRRRNRRSDRTIKATIARIQKDIENEADISAQSNQTRQNPRIFKKNVNQAGATYNQSPAGEGAQTTGCLIAAPRKQPTGANRHRNRRLDNRCGSKAASCIDSRKSIDCGKERIFWLLERKDGASATPILLVSSALQNRPGLASRSLKRLATLSSATNLSVLFENISEPTNRC